MIGRKKAKKAKIFLRRTMAAEFHRMAARANTHSEKEHYKRWENICKDIADLCNESATLSEEQERIWLKMFRSMSSLEYSDIERCDLVLKTTEAINSSRC